MGAPERTTNPRLRKREGCFAPFTCDVFQCRSRNLAILLAAASICSVAFIFALSIPRQAQPMDLQLKSRNYTLPASLDKPADRSALPRCHNGTRVASLNEIMEVAERPASGFTPVIWITGPAGAGKSAIIQTLANKWEQDKRLGAVVSFSRTDFTPHNQTFIIGNIAYQMTRTLPELRPILDEVVKRNPSLFAQPLKTQMDELIEKPLKRHYLSKPSRIEPKFIVLDGLDEVLDTTFQSELISSFVSMLKPRPLPLRLVLSTRTETHIGEILSPLGSYLSRTDLNSARDTSTDIERFLETEFNDIKKASPVLNTSSWPPPKAVSTIVRQSGGRFVYAATAVGYIKAGDPETALQDVINLNEGKITNAEVSLDALYTHILLSFQAETLALAWEILSHLVVPPPSHSDTGERLDGHSFTPTLDKFLAIRGKEIERNLDRLRVLFPIDIISNPSPRDGHSLRIRPVQRTLIDFISNPGRAGKFYLSNEQARANVALILAKHSSFMDTPDSPSLCQYVANATPSAEFD